MASTNTGTANNLLSLVTINSPCKMDWDLMTGDERIRFCDHCQKNVYNISAMTNDEATNLINETEGQICARLYRRSDGTVVTRDCPQTRERFEISASRRRLQFSMSSLLILVTASAGLCASAPWIGKKIQPFVDRMFPPPPVETPYEVLMGEAAMPTPAEMGVMAVPVSAVE